jgi:hypothetical protein
MHIYNNLNDDVKASFRKDIFQLLIMTIIEVYCILILSLSNAVGHFSYHLLGILGLNLLVSAHISYHLLDKIRYNRIEEYWDICCIMLIVFYICGTVVITVEYYININQYKLFIYLEFGPILLYTIIYSGIIIYFMTKELILCGSNCFNFLKETKEAVEEREYLLKTKKSTEETIVQ